VNHRIALVGVALAGAVGLWFSASGVAAGPPAKHTVTIEATGGKDVSRGSSRLSRVRVCSVLMGCAFMRENYLYHFPVAFE